MTGDFSFKKGELMLRCPTCRKETTWQDNPFRPFCSERCKMVDLGRWAKEEYRIPDKPAPENEEPEEE